MREQQRVAIVGAGFSGAALTARLLARESEHVHVTLIEASGRFGRGAAYGTHCAEHLLNTRADRMSLLAEEPEHFVRWCRVAASRSATRTSRLAESTATTLRARCVPWRIVRERAVRRSCTRALPRSSRPSRNSRSYWTTAAHCAPTGSCSRRGTRCRRHLYEAVYTDPTVYSRPFTVRIPSKKFTEESPQDDWHNQTFPANHPGGELIMEAYERTCVENNDGHGEIAAKVSAGSQGLPT